MGGFGKDAGGQHLITDLCQIARSHGHCALTSNGSAGRGCKNQRVLICSHARKYHPKAVSCKMEDMEMDTTTYRVTTYIGDKKNARGSKSSGKALKRRTSTLRDSGCACTAKLVIRLDQLSFYLVCGLGDNKHTGHPPMESNEITNRKRYLDVATLENVTAMAAANILPAQAVSLTRIQTGELFTRGQMAYVQGFSRMARNLMDDKHCLPDASPSENMLHYLRKTGASFVCLYQNGKAKEKEFRRGNRKVAAPTESFDRSSMGQDRLMSLSLMEGSSAVHTLIPLEVTECADFKDYAEKSRNAVGARDDQDMLIACCWVLPNGRRLFHAFPEVVGVDGTHETNNESRPLLTLSVKDSDGNVIVVVRCFAPNERSWLFRWFFQEALPLLLGPEALKMVNLIMTDGDSQEMAQVDYAIDTFFVNAVRTRCGWHLVHQGWRRECRGLGFRKGKKAAAKRQVRIIQNWLYSWMRRGVNSKAHYEISKALLIMYLKSDVVKSVFGDDGGDKLLHFIRGTIIPHEQSFCFYMRKGIRHFETTTNSGHEGTNNAIKSGPSGVLPQHQIDKSAKIQVDRDCAKFDLYRRHCAATLLGTATWSTSQTVNDLTLPAEFMLQFATQESEHYASWRISKSTWLVVRSVERNVRSLVPRFNNVHTISLLPPNHDCLTCDCEYFECNGMVCQHLVHVKKYYAHQSQITHHDVSVRWWKAYLYFSSKSTLDCSAMEKTIKQELEKLRQNDCRGPSFTEKIWETNSNIPSLSHVYCYGENSHAQFQNATEGHLKLLFKKESIVDQVINYSRDEVLVALNSTSSNVPLSMSQEVYMHESTIEHHNSFDENDDADEPQDFFVESAVDSDYIDFGSHLFYEHGTEQCQESTLFYNPYETLMPRVKELVTLVAASKHCRERGIAVEQALDNLISQEKANLASQKPPPRGGVVSACLSGKVKKTKVSEWGG